MELNGKQTDIKAIYFRVAKHYNAKFPVATAGKMTGYSALLPGGCSVTASI